MIEQDDELEDAEPPLVGVEDFDDEEDARAAARLLVEHGIGATIERMVAEEPDELAAGLGPADGDEGPEPAPRPVGDLFYRLLVLDHEERRALEILGVVEPEARPEANPVEPMVRPRTKIPWKKVLPIYLLALIGLPAAAFYFTYLVMSR